MLFSVYYFVVVISILSHMEKKREELFFFLVVLLGEYILYPYSDDKSEGLAHISALIYFNPDLEKLPSLHKENTAFKSPC